MITDNTIILVGIVVVFIMFIMCLPLITGIVIGHEKEVETEEIYTYKGNRYILLDKPTLNKNKETRMWERVVNYSNEERTLYFTREIGEFYEKFKIEKDADNI